MWVDIWGSDLIDINSKEELVEYISDNIDILYPIFKDAIWEQMQNILQNDPTLTQDQVDFINTILNKILDWMLIPN
jgi:hypothetical protein